MLVKNKRILVIIICLFIIVSIPSIIDIITNNLNSINKENYNYQYHSINEYLINLNNNNNNSSSSSSFNSISFIESLKNIVYFRDNTLQFVKTKNDKIPVFAVHFINHCVISRMIFETGYWHKDQTIFMIDTLTEFNNCTTTDNNNKAFSNSFIDVGANIGWFSYIMLNEGLITFSFEPSPYNIQIHNINNLLQHKNIRKNIHFFSKAIGEHTRENQTLCFGTNINSDNRGNFQEQHQDRSKNKQEINNLDCKNGFINTMTSIDKELIFNKHYNKIISKNKPFLLKIDVEGFELNVLKGSSNLLDSFPPNFIFVEINGEIGKSGFSEQNLKDFIISKNYIFCKKIEDDYIFIYKSYTSKYC